ncbi:hypothetical protein ACI0X9_003379 [Cronobacter turicensis]
MKISDSNFLSFKTVCLCTTLITSLMNNAVSAGFSPEERTADSPLNLSRLLVNLNGRPELLWGPFVTEGPYTPKTLGTVRRGIDGYYVFFLRDGFYLGNRALVDMPDNRIALITDGKGRQLYCEASVMRGDKNAVCAEFRGPPPKSHSVGDKPFGDFRPEKPVPERSLNVGRVLVNLPGANGPLPPRLIYGPLRVEGPYRYSVPKTTIDNDGHSSVVLMRDRVWMTNGAMPPFPQYTAYIVRDKDNQAYLCESALVDMKKGANCVRLAGSSD